MEKNKELNQEARELMEKLSSLVEAGLLKKKDIICSLPSNTRVSKIFTLVDEVDTTREGVYKVEGGKIYFAPLKDEKGRELKFYYRALNGKEEVEE